MGLRFANPLGVAAGYDKDAEGVRGLARLGFGAVEVGTVTARPQPGNPRPRLFRLPADRALVNRMGFNNAGADVVAARLAAVRARGAGTVVGVNIGRSKTATDAVADYRYSARVLGPHADYVVVNVSSPNTPGLRDLQGVDALEPLLAAVRSEVGATPAAREDHRGPGRRRGRRRRRPRRGPGPRRRSSRPTRRSRAPAWPRRPTSSAPRAPAGSRARRWWSPRGRCWRACGSASGDRLTLVSVGGIDSGAEARARLDAGATLVQAYTGFVYGGPAWPRRVLEELT